MAALTSCDTSIPETLRDGGPLPRLIAFDLDYTLWPFWVDTHVDPPLKASGKYNTVLDRHGNSWHFYHDVPQILHSLHRKRVRVAAASRTHTPKLAREMLSLLTLDPEYTGGETGRRGIDYFDETEIYPGDKISHFRSLQHKTDIKYADMLFFDDEPRNRNVERELGVRTVMVPDGLSTRVFDNGIRAWRNRYEPRYDFTMTGAQNLEMHGRHKRVFN